MNQLTKEELRSIATDLGLMMSEGDWGKRTRAEILALIKRRENGNVYIEKIRLNLDIFC